MAARPQGHRALAVPDIRDLFYKEVFQCAKSLGFLSSGIFNSSGDFVAGLELPVPIDYFRRAITILCERVLANLALDIAREGCMVAPQLCGFNVHEDNVGKRYAWVNTSHLLNFCRFEIFLSLEVRLALGDKTLPVKILLTTEAD